MIGFKSEPVGEMIECPSISQAGIDFIKSHELLRLDAYLCPAGVPTIGWGSTRGVAMGMRITEEQAEARLRDDLAKAETVVRKTRPNFTRGQYDALVSLAFNIGAPAYGSSTMKECVEEGKWAKAAKQFDRWIYARDPKTKRPVVLPGLVKRRAAERAMFEGK